MFYSIFRIVGRNLLKLFNLRLVKISLSERMLSSFDKNQVIFLQVGANDGVSFDCLYDFVSANNWSGVAVEPLKEFYEKLCINYSGFTKVQLVNLAIHPTDKYISLFKVDPSFYGDFPDWVKGIASFEKMHLIRNGVPENKITTETVHCINLMELIDQYNLYNVDYIQIDTEGFDFEIIKMIDFNKIKPKMIKFEHAHLSEDNMNAAKKLLIMHGYKFKKDKQDFFAYL